MEHGRGTRPGNSRPTVGRLRLRRGLPLFLDPCIWNTQNLYTDLNLLTGSVARVTCHGPEVLIMSVSAKPSRAMTARERMQARRERLRAQGLRPIQYWVPDLRNPRVRAVIRREAALLSNHPENSSIDAWIESAYDWGETR